MPHKIQYLKVKFVLGSSSVLIGLAGATVALFLWIEMPETQYLFGEFSRYVLGFGGFAAMIFGALLANDAWVLRGVLRGVYEMPTGVPMSPFSATYAKEQRSKEITQTGGISTSETDYQERIVRDIWRSYKRSRSLRGKLTRFLRSLVGRSRTSKSHSRTIGLPAASIVRLAVVPKPAGGSKILFEGTATPVVERSDNIKMVCDKCGELLVDGVSAGQIRNTVIRCPRCGSYCETP
jgi:DNA-directed RNA polymerase subunit RPC12/RpoP